MNELRFLRKVKAFMVHPTDYNIRVHEDNEGVIKWRRTGLEVDEQDKST